MLIYKLYDKYCCTIISRLCGKLVLSLFCKGQPPLYAYLHGGDICIQVSLRLLN